MEIGEGDLDGDEAPEDDGASEPGSETRSLTVIVRMDFLERGSDYTADTLPDRFGGGRGHDLVRFGLGDRDSPEGDNFNQGVRGRGGAFEHNENGAARPLPNARVALLRGPTEVASAQTDGDGEATLDITGRDGAFTVLIRPEASAGRRDHQATTRAGKAGPKVAERGDEAYALIFAEAQVQIQLSAGTLAGATDPFELPSAGNATGRTGCRIGNRRAWAIQADPALLPVDLRPIYWRSYSSNVGPRDAAITHVVVHRTGGGRISGAMQTWLPPTGAAAHYSVDLNGHITKHVSEALSAPHAGPGRWAGRLNVNGHSIGIELINAAETPSKPFPEPQYFAVIDLIRRLQRAHRLDPWNVIGHCDVRIASRHATQAASYRYDQGPRGRHQDPGQHFRWGRLFAAGIGMGPRLSEAEVVGCYGGYFETGAALQSGGNARDASLPGFEGAGVIEQIQDDLASIGYSLGSPAHRARHRGEYDEATAEAVERFQLHFMSGRAAHSRHRWDRATVVQRRLYLGTVDRETAQLLARVVGPRSPATPGVGVGPMMP